MNMANNGMVMAQQLQNLGMAGGEGAAGCGTVSTGLQNSTIGRMAFADASTHPGWQTYAPPTQMRYSVPGAVVRGELDERLNTAEEIARIKAVAAKARKDAAVRLVTGCSTLYPSSMGSFANDTRSAYARAAVAGAVAPEPFKLSLKTTPLFRHLRWKFDSPFAPVSRAFAKWVLSWRYA